MFQGEREKKKTSIVDTLRVLLIQNYVKAITAQVAKNSKALRHQVRIDGMKMGSGRMRHVPKKTLHTDHGTNSRQK